MTESEWARKYSKLLTGGGAVVMAVLPEGMQEPGWPDRWVCHRRWTGWLENKKGSNVLSALQRRKLELLRERGQAAFTLRWINDIIRWEATDVVIHTAGYIEVMDSWQTFLSNCKRATDVALSEGIIWQPQDSK